MTHLAYRNKIDASLRLFAWNIPFVSIVLHLAHPVLPLLDAVVPLSKGLTCQRKQVGSVPIKIYSPEGTSLEVLPCLFYIHGGGFGYGEAPYHIQLVQQYAEKVRCRVVTVDYRLLPAYRYPAEPEDVKAVYRWILSHAEELKIDRNKVAVGGDSAGGCLTATLVNSCRNTEMPCFQMLIYPVTDALQQTESVRKYQDTPLWNAKNNAKMWNRYLKGTSVEEQKAASPMQNRLPKGLPSTYVEVAEYDCLHDEGLAYAERLRAAGVQVAVNDTKGTYHGYDICLYSKLVKEQVAKRIKALQDGFAAVQSAPQDRSAFEKTAVL